MCFLRQIREWNEWNINISYLIAIRKRENNEIEAYIKKGLHVTREVVIKNEQITCKYRKFKQINDLSKIEWFSILKQPSLFWKSSSTNQVIRVDKF